ncbi:hypothetical protein C1H46_027619 [Malus baccata]|uniref:Uncharacterized protein n=1 Tax=Malus baccata TaxID=106549 RepID=A0A540LK48_MALBA|nr:hypothetical protein C1H46_027619 [Malus baccata]
MSWRGRCRHFRTRQPPYQHRSLYNSANQFSDLISWSSVARLGFMSMIMMHQKLGSLK